MDDADRAAELQARFNDSALEARLPPQLLAPNLVCRDCGDRNDRPDYAICHECLEKRQGG